MTENPEQAALADIENALVAVESAHHALGYILDELPRHGSDEVVACIMRTLGTAAEQGRASFDILHKALVAAKK